MIKNLMMKNLMIKILPGSRMIKKLPGSRMRLLIVVGGCGDWRE